MMKIQVILITVYLVSSTYCFTRCTGVTKPECTFLFPTCFFNITCNGETWNELHGRTLGYSGVCRDSRGYAYDESDSPIFMTNGKSLPDCIEKAYRYNAFAVMFSMANWYPDIYSDGGDYYFSCKLLFQSGKELPPETIGTTNRRRSGVGNIAFVTNHNSLFCWAPQRSILVKTTPPQITSALAPQITSEPESMLSNLKKNITNQTSIVNEEIIIVSASVAGTIVVALSSFILFQKIKSCRQRQVTV